MKGEGRGSQASKWQAAQGWEYAKTSAVWTVEVSLDQKEYTLLLYSFCVEERLHIG